MALLDPASSPQIGKVSPPSRPGLLLTKLYAPRVRRELVVRPRLLDALDRGADRKLTLVSTPPGYGKSTLVVQWLAGADRPAAWVSLDEGDNDPPTFFTYIVAAIQSIDPGIARGTSTVLDTRSGGPTRAILHSLLNELALVTRPFVLVLDDYHVVETPEIHDGIGYFLQNLPLQLRVIITSRTDPPLPLVRMRARGELQELRAADLRFTNQEAQELLQGLHKLDVTLSELAALEDRTEGWAVGLHLVAHAVQGHPRERVEQLVTELTGNVRLLDDYLWAEAIQQRPPEVKSFLLRSAIFDRFNADLCDAVLGDAGSAAVIRELERANLFLVPLDERGHWYRYHHFFADVLRDHLAQQATDDEICKLHVRAAAWFEAHDFAEEAIRHAVAGRDWDRAIRLLRDLGAWLYGQDRVVTMRYWLQGLPTDILERDPKLCYWLAWALMRLGEFDAGTRPLRLAEQAWTASNDLAELGASMHLHIMLDFLNQNTHRAIEHAHRALDLLPEDRPTDRSIVYVMLGATHLYTGDLIEAERAFAQARVLAERVGHLWSQLVELNGFGEILCKRGRLTEATTLFRRAIALGDEWSDEQVQNAHWQLASVSYELNRLDVAEQHLHRAMELIERMGAPLHLVRIHPLLAQIAWARQDAETAYEEIERAITQTARVGSRLYFLQAARALRARFWLASNHLDLARRWADECGLDPYAPPEYGRQFEHLTIIRLLILEGHADVALRLLDRLLEVADAAERGRDVLEMLILRALAQHAQEDQEGAATTLDRALKFGAPEGLVRIFADEGPRLIPLLRYAAARGQHRDYAHRLLAAIDGSVPASAPDQEGLVSPLSEREVEVLRLVAAGLPNRDVGQRLFISEKTVKKHLSNILGKLGATNRTQAVDQARRLGLL